MSSDYQMIFVADVAEKLTPFIDENYEWPSQPEGWSLEFIVYKDGEVEMDFLHPVSGRFWSEDDTNKDLILPTVGGKRISWKVLKQANVPFMTTFGEAMVSNEPKPCHLKAV